jgi:hypothetical protein
MEQTKKLAMIGEELRQLGAGLINDASILLNNDTRLILRSPAHEEHWGAVEDVDAVTTTMQADGLRFCEFEAIANRLADLKKEINYDPEAHEEESS